MSDIETHLSDGVLNIIINRPSKKNALTREMYEDMAVAIDNSTDHGARVVLIAGQGDCFTAGNNIADFASVDDAEHVNETVHFMQSLMNCPLPVVAKVKGLAVGIGTTLLLHCDLVYCDDNAKFVMPFIDLGLVPEYASSYLLPRIAGHRKAAEWLMLGKPFGAQEALQFGIVNDSFAAEDIDSMVEKVVQALKSKPTAALQKTKKLMKYDAISVSEHMAEELDVFIERMRSAPAQEAFSAFLNKRPVNREIFK